MPSVLIDIPTDDLEIVKRVADTNHRSRKAQLELIIEQWLEKNKE